MTHGGKQKLLLLALIVVAFLSWEVGKLAAQTWQKVVPSGGSSNEWQCSAANVGSYTMMCVRLRDGKGCYGDVINNSVWTCFSKGSWPGP
jgi:hypothetical protein